MSESNVADVVASEAVAEPEREPPVPEETADAASGEDLAMETTEGEPVEESEATEAAEEVAMAAAEDQPMEAAGEEATEAIVQEAMEPTEEEAAEAIEQEVMEATDVVEQQAAEVVGTVQEETLPSDGTVPTEATVSQEPTEGMGAASTSEAAAKQAKKESFQWSTPADEFAEDVGSDIEDVGEEDGAGDEGMVQVMITPKANKPKTPKQKFPCPKCHKIWNWPWELRRHLLMHFKEKERLDASAYKCEECGKGFQWKRDLAQHNRLHTGEKLLVCSVCGKKFVTRQALLHHVVVHTGEKPFQCAICGNRFTQPANLRTHTKKKHDDGPIKGCKCPHCQENFSSVIAVHQHILEDHQNIVAEEREEQALLRLKKEQEKLEKEKRKFEIRRRREEKRKEKADLNDFRDPNKQEWELNYEFHLGEGMVRGVDWDRTPSNGELGCEECDRKFGWRYEIMFHRLCHMVDEEGNARNKVCPECDTVFKVPIGLKHHLLLHTGELPFLCLHCWRSFSSHIDLKLHIRREHLFHLELPTPKPAKKKVQERPRRVKKEEHAIPTFVNEAGESVQFIIQQDEEGQMIADNQTIVVNPDGTIVNPNNQDMIVVIQSDDYDQSQGVVVVDPSQLQQIVGNNGVPMAVAQDGQTMIVSDGGQAVADQEDGAEMIISDQQQSNEGTQYISLEVGEDGAQQHVVLTTNAEGQQTANINGNDYLVVQADENEYASQNQGEVEAKMASETEQQTSIIVQEMLESNQEAAMTNGQDEGQQIIIQEGVADQSATEVKASTLQLQGQEASQG